MPPRPWGSRNYAIIPRECGRGNIPTLEISPQMSKRRATRRTIPRVTTIFDKGLFRPMKIGFSRVVLRAPRAAIYASAIQQDATTYPENIWFLAQLVCFAENSMLRYINRDVILLPCVFDCMNIHFHVNIFYTIFTIHTTRIAFNAVKTNSYDL